MERQARSSHHRPTWSCLFGLWCFQTTMRCGGHKPADLECLRQTTRKIFERPYPEAGPPPNVDMQALRTRVHSRPQQGKQVGQPADPHFHGRKLIGEGRPLSDRPPVRMFRWILDQQSNATRRSSATPQGTVVPPLLEEATYTDQYPRSSKISPPDFAEEISPVGESPGLCPTSLIPLSIRFASRVHQSSRQGPIAKWTDLCPFLFMMIMGQNASDYKLLINTNRAYKPSGVQVRDTRIFYWGKKGIC